MRRREQPLGRPYWVLWTAGAISYAGDGIMFGALPLLAASITRDPRVVSLSEAVANVGWLVAIYAVGGVLGAVLAPRLSRRLTTATSLIGSMVVSGCAVVLFGVLVHLGPIAVSAAVLGFAGTWWNVVSITLRQRIVPAELLGRVTAVYRMVAFCAAPLGAVGAGFLAHRTDLRTPYLVMGLVQLAATALYAPLIRREVRLLPSAEARSAG